MAISKNVLVAAILFAMPVAAQDLSSDIVSPTKILAEGFKTLTELTSGLDSRAANIAAFVDDTPITDGDLADEIRTYPASIGRLPMTNVYQIALENLMRQRALALRARREGVDKDPAAQRRLALAAERALVAEYMRREITPKINEQTLRARYEKNIAGQPGPLEARARVIVTATREDALAAIARLTINPDFGFVAREFSKDDSAARGGDLGFVPPESIDPAIAAVLFSMNPGGVSANPVKGAQGWFVVRNEGLRQPGPPSFEAVREQLRREMAAADMAAIRSGIQAKIVVEPGKPPRVETEKPK